MSDQACEWSPELPCPFVKRLGEKLVHDGRQFCAFHAPLAAKKNIDRVRLAKLFRTLQEDGVQDFSGVELPAPQRYDVIREIRLRDCKFDGNVEIVISNVPCDLAGSEFIGTAIVHTHSVYSGTLNFSACHFRGNLDLHNAGSHAVLNLAGATFGAESRFSQVGDATRLVFADCQFAAAPTFAHTPELPARTHFNGARFRQMRGEDESSYRAVRNYFNAQRARDWEGQFYVYEKRCQRLGMTRPQELFGRVFSCLYDWSSMYGYSYARALTWFCGIQVAFGLAYAAMAGRLALGGRLDGAVIAFTFAQVAKPFELFGRAAAQGIDPFIPEAGGGWWLALTAAQSVMSIVFVALFLLALRWRFRRE